MGAVRGYDVRIIMPDSVSVERRKICEAYGAQIELVHDDGDIGKAIATSRSSRANRRRQTPTPSCPTSSRTSTTSPSNDPVCREILMTPTSPASSSMASPAAEHRRFHHGHRQRALLANPDTIV